MTRAAILASCLCVLPSITGCEAKPIDVPDAHASPATVDAQRLVTGRSIPATMPVVRQNVGSLPMNLITTADRRFAIVSDMGFRQALWTIRTSDGKGVDHVEYERKPKTNGLYYGLAIAPDGTLYAAQGGNASIAVLHVDAEGKLTPDKPIKTPKRDFPAGLALDDRGHLFVTSNEPDQSADAPLNAPGSVAAYNTATGTELGRFTFGTEFPATTNYPLAITSTHDGSKVFVASQRDGRVHVLDFTDPAKPKQLTSIETGSHPSALLLDAKQATLYVANADSDTISFVDVATMKVRRTIQLRPAIASQLAGASPVGLALSPDEDRLYAALGDMNAIAVIDVDADSRGAELEGYVPAGWYPSAVVTAGSKVLVANAKGLDATNPNPPEPPRGRSPVPTTQLAPTTTEATRHQSPLNILEGDVMTIDAPPKASLAGSTKEVLELCRLTPRYLNRANPLAHVPIKHVIYIVKENRTYDQVLGDLPQGNGDPSYCIFGRSVTPNLHALAERFVLLDNFYDSGEVSGDGWVWSTQAMANEYVIKNVPYQYSNRGRVFDYEGENNGYPTGGFPAKDLDGAPLSQHPKLVNGAPEIPDVAATAGGHLWDMARKQNVSFRNYGFFVADGVTRGGVQVTPENYPTVKGLQPAGHDLAGVTDRDFLHFDLDYADSDGPAQLADAGDAAALRTMQNYGTHKATSRFAEWQNEFDQMLKRDPSGKAVPSLMFVRFCTDHTAGLNGGKPTPRSMVADNDYAVGQLVEAISHSPIWKDTAIFVIEDDAQNGPDHVDAHRSTCYVISPWIKRASVDHSFQNTVSCIRTIELLGGLNPMNAYDASADPILNWDTTASNAEPFEAIHPDAATLKERNPSAAPTTPVSPEQSTMRDLRDESERMNFAQADHAPADRLNVMIWKSVKGPASDLPFTPHGPASLAGPAAKDDDDD